MVKYPRVLQRAQQVVDKVCGTERSPRFDDLEDLGYCQHCVDEVSVVLVTKVGEQPELNHRRFFVGARSLRVTSHTA